MIFDLLVAICVLIILGVVMIIAKLLSKRLSPEGSRKTIHITMGCVALTFPFVFESTITVVVLGIVAILALLYLRVNKNLREGVGTALLGIHRKSIGDIYFVISIVIVFVLHDHPFEYIIPISILTFADSTAALIGTSYGRHNMSQHNQEDAKSREGSVIFFIVAFICSLVPLQLMTEVGRAEVLVISFLIGFLAAIIEAVSRHGNDNLLLPFLTYGFLIYNSQQPLNTLLSYLGLMVLVAFAIFLIYKLTNITKLSIAYSFLVGYIVLILGDAIWIFPPLALLLTFGILPMMKKDEKKMTQSYKAVECNAIIGVICLYISVFLPQYREILYIAFSFSFSCHLAINTYSRLVNFFQKSKSNSILYGLIKGIIFIALPTWFVVQTHLVMFIYLILLALSMPFAVSLNEKYDYTIVSDETCNANKFLVGILTTILTAILLVLTMMEVL